MRLLELKQIIREHLARIDAVPFLNALRTFIESKVSIWEY